MLRRLDWSVGPSFPRRRGVTFPELARFVEQFFVLVVLVLTHPANEHSYFFQNEDRLFALVGDSRAGAVAGCSLLRAFVDDRMPPLR